MHIVSRKAHDKIVFPGLATTIEEVNIKGNVVRLGITAPPDLKVLRAERMTGPVCPATCRSAMPTSRPGPSTTPSATG